jgi:hypothetical protein
MAQGGFNAARAVATNPIAQKAARFGIGATAATTGAVLSTMATGNPMMGAAAGMAVGGLANKGLGGIASTIGGGVQNIGESLSGSGSVGDIIQSKAMSGEGGLATKAMANVGWGLQSAYNKISGDGGNSPANYFSQNKETLATAQKGMTNIQPQYQTATARFEQMKAQYGPGSKWHEENADIRTGKVNPMAMPDEYKKVEQNYNTHKATFEGHRANAMEAQANLKDFSQFKAYMNQDPSYSTGRGKI